MKTDSSLIRGMMISMLFLVILGHFTAYPLYPDIIGHLVSRFTGGAQWYELFKVSSNPMRALMSLPWFSDVGILMLGSAGILGIAALALFLGLHRQGWLMAKRSHRLQFALTIVIILTSWPIFCLRMYDAELVEEAKRLDLAAVPGKLQTFDAVLDRIPPHTSLAALENQVKILGLKPTTDSEDPELKDAGSAFTKIYELGFLAHRDFWEAELTVILYTGKDGKLIGWKHRSRRLVTVLPYDERIRVPSSCRILKEYPAKGKLPRNCSLDWL